LPDPHRRAATTAAVLSTFDQELLTIASHTLAAKTYQEEHERALSTNIREIFERQKDKGGMNMLMRRAYVSGANVSGGGDKDSMDVDEISDNLKGKNRKCVTFCWQLPSSDVV
jgi:COP9 signalosome complex subunit 7